MKAKQKAKPISVAPPRRAVLPTAVSQAAPEPPSQQAIALRAYEIWQRHGCPADSAYHDWIAAEAELRAAQHS